MINLRHRACWSRHAEYVPKLFTAVAFPLIKRST
jgi:hypothetical protein